MEKAGTLSIPEFLTDLREVLTAPKRRFALIRERGVLWGSLLLLVAPAYFGFWWIGGLYFEGDPIPGYSIFAPAVFAVLVSLIKVLFIHFCARLFEGRAPSGETRGSFTGALTVFGYAAVPGIIAVTLGLTFFLALPGVLGLLLRDFRAVAISILIAVSLVFFIWHLILVVHALRTVYSMRDLKIVASFILGSLLMGVPVFSIMMVAAEVRADLSYVRPILSERVLRIYQADSESSGGRPVKIEIMVDLIRYRFNPPRRNELVAFEPSSQFPRQQGEGAVVIGSSSGITLRHGEQILGRVVALPGERVELSSGALVIDGRLCNEPYVLPQYQSSASLPARRLGGTEYLVLPDDRTLVEAAANEWFVERARITGRLITNRWPVGWFIFSPTVYLEAAPSPQ